MNELKLKKALNVFSYAAVVFLGIALLISFIAEGEILFKTIADIMSYAIVSVLAFFYAKTKRNIAYMIVYVLSVLLIILMIILPTLVS